MPSVTGGRVSILTGTLAVMVLPALSVARYSRAKMPSWRASPGSSTTSPTAMPPNRRRPVDPGRDAELDARRLQAAVVVAGPHVEVDEVRFDALAGGPSRPITSSCLDFCRRDRSTTTGTFVAPKTPPARTRLVASEREDATRYRDISLSQCTSCPCAGCPSAVGRARREAASRSAARTGDDRPDRHPFA